MARNTHDKWGGSGIRLEVVLRILGLALLGIYVFARLHGFLWNYAGIQAHSLLSQNQAEATTTVPAVDFSLWDGKRIQAYKESLIKKFAPPLAVLRINRIRLEVSVLEGTDDITLNRAVGHIEGTATIDSGGNIGIAGHRDGFFRGLKDLQVGDSIELDSNSENRIYVVDAIRIVQPEDAWVLDSRSNPSITLVTCYPFYFIGHAPQRYIIQASLKQNLSKKISK